MAVLHTWDSTTEGWAAVAGSTVARDTSTFRTGSGSLRVTKTVAAVGEAPVEAGGPANPSLSGDILEAWMMVPVGSPGTGHHGQLRVMYGGGAAQPWSFVNGAYPGPSMTPGVWTKITLDLTGVDLPNVYQIQARVRGNTTGGGGDLTFYMDDMSVDESTPPPPPDPEPPTGVSVTSGGLVSFTAAVPPDGATVTGYTVTATPVAP